MQADLVLIGGTIYTLDPSRPRAEGIAVRSGRIAAVGGTDSIGECIGTGTVVIDTTGKTVLPGLVDCHCHLYGLGHMLEQIPLHALPGPREVAHRVGEAARNRPPGEWIEGWGWDQNGWSPPVFPTHEVLDAAVPAHPVVLRRIDGHAIWLNEQALRQAGIAGIPSDPPGGRILRDAHGEPTGVLLDKAISLIDGRIPAPSPEARARMILRAADAAAAAGLTGVHEMNISDDTAAVYRSLAAAGRLKVRVYAFLRGLDQIDSLPEREPDRDPGGTAFFVLRGVKLFADGALGSRGAALLAPYCDDPGNTGLLLDTPEFLRHAAAVAASSGWQLTVHAIGDRANRVVLDGFAAVPDSGKCRFRVEHAQIVAPEDTGRFAQLGITASIQPGHAIDDMAWVIDRLGMERLPEAYAWRSIYATGAHMLGGSDFPVAKMSPLRGLYAAVTRRDEEGKPPGGWLPDQCLTLDEALRLYTVEAAWSAFAEGRRGVISPGYVADLTVLDGELTADQRLLERRVAFTLVGGHVVAATSS